MGVYLVTYDLHDPTRSADLLEYIGQMTSVQVTESSYAVQTNRTPQHIVTAILGIAPDITVYVFPIGSPYCGFARKAVNDWLAARLS